VANFERGLFHWERFVPQIANNRDLPTREQLALEIATGLSVLEVETFTRANALAAASGGGEPPKAPGANATEEELRTYVAAAKAEMTRLRTEQAARLAPHWAPFVRLVPGSHTVNGKPIATLADYLELVLMQQGLFNFLEISNEVLALNSVSGAQSLFSRALSGGSDSTQDQNSADERAGR